MEERGAVLLYMADIDELVALGARLGVYGYRVLPVGSLEESKRALDDHKIALALIEVRSGDAHAIEVIAQTKSRWSSVPVAVLSSNKDVASRIAARDAGADDYLATPVRTIDLEMRMAQLNRMVQLNLRQEPDSELEPDRESKTEAECDPHPEGTTCSESASEDESEPELESPTDRDSDPDLDLPISEDKPLSTSELLLELEQARAETVLSRDECTRARSVLVLVRERLQQAQERVANAEARLAVADAPVDAGDRDSLTGLPGRGALQDQLDREYARSRRYGHALTLLMLDVDRMGRFEKKHGQGAAQEALRQLAELLQSTVRSPDLLARAGSDAFVILATDTTEEQGLQLAERLQRTLAASREERSLPRLTVSIGIASSKRLQVARAADLLEAAERAVAEAKNTGRNRCQVAAD